MSQICRRCSRANPPEALYCYHDGAALDALHAAPLAVGGQPFSHPFVFANGRACRNFDELVVACDDDWEAGKEMLRLGFFTGFLDAIGRPDLSLLARQSAKLRDTDRGLDQLLQKLPCTTRSVAGLVVHPLEINLGQLLGTVPPQFSLHLRNSGGGMIYGRISSEVDWLALGDAPGLPSKVFQFHLDCDISARVVAKNLRSGAKPLDGRLVVETNAGIALVMVRLEVPSRPFPRGALAGATTPRELAKKAKAAPKQAATLFEMGTVRRWYETNGWTYPIPAGQAAPGLAGLQQFFEALGLAKPPRIVTEQRNVQLSGLPGEALQYVVHLRAVEKKFVFAQAQSTTSWLKVTNTTMNGQRAQIFVRVASVPNLPGNRMHGFIQVTANGGQRFTVEVHLTVLGMRETAEDVDAIPLATRVEEPEAIPVATRVEETEVIQIAPMKLDDLLSPIPVDPEEQLS